MAEPSVSAPALSADEVRHLIGDAQDWKVAAIASTGATAADIEAAAAWLEGQDDIMGEARHPLTGPAAAVYDILVRAGDFPGFGDEAPPA
ncbi:MAG TPA: hypothetical protein VG939_05710 [Caulobacteraceae bacterium]|nr:hypothetical protein [Caulobacteraceae bacterium]